MEQLTLEVTGLESAEDAELEDYPSWFVKLMKEYEATFDMKGFSLFTLFVNQHETLGQYMKVSVDSVTGSEPIDPNDPTIDHYTRSLVDDKYYPYCTNIVFTWNDTAAKTMFMLKYS